METFKLPLPFGSPQRSRLIDVSGERKLQGGADTRVFKILGIGEQFATQDTESVARDAEGLAFATIHADERLDLVDRDRGSDPYNRLGRRMR